ncbi:GRAM domain-containing protein 4-like isoform X1 [Daphnia pulex]|uniref:GRAM domain-containing protein 4-like isoform X1 n=1 Tax=Daphnia pulex TaxID=6669 RepID=UPI001EDCC0CA|nr:GRAM domain-containing protein 4-like isoform X1 [Daphnia pulex]XP_046463509.1 GRAM domain-containing protein 4-like isoform X1 [Daphnia pulex]
MSLRGIRSRLRQGGSGSGGGCDSDQGSPSRSASFFQQLAAFLGPDEPTSSKGSYSQEDDGANPGGTNLEDQLLSLVVMAKGGRSSAAMETDAAGTASSQSDTSEPNSIEQTNFQQQQQLKQANASPGSQHKTVHRLVNESSVDLTGSDRDTDKEGSLTDLNDVVRPRRSVAQSIRRRAMQSAKSGAELQEQPSNSCPGQTPRRNRFAHRDKRRSERSISLDRSVRSASIPPSLDKDDTGSTLTRNDEMSQTSKEAVGSGDTSSRLPHHRIAAWARELMDDLQSIEDETDQGQGSPKENNADDLGDSLAVKRLKNNILRFGRITGAISSSCDSIQSIRQWQSPTASILFLLVSSYAIWHGLFLVLVVAASLWKLTINYLTSQGWLRHFGWNMGGDHQDADESSNDGNKSSTSVIESVSVILQVARKVQNQLGNVCDAAEKIKNLLMWRHEASRRLYLILWLALLVTLLVPAAQLSTFVGFYLLLKVMIVDYVFFKFPRLRAKYDTSSLIWQTLPTDADLDARRKVEQGLRNAAASAANAETRTFWESFNLPPNEHPLSGWQNGLRATLVNRDKSLTSSFKSGRLFLTPSYLCFERSKTQPGKNVVIPLDRIIRLEKGNQYSWIPGGGMIIEVFVQGLDRAYTFGAIMNRDDVFNSIRDAAEGLGCIWREDNNKSGSS